ncbi:ABC transporter ATP-binding protein [Butyrivibrio sp. MC2013]|uniref:ABC transporter ATP-binding protein n=1 Tax=Butyrivibrio sp. MC2013 TaxID=1280686 RepID=UPI0004137622|nr:ABC transporter ATP-binding protein [Butyrivibrio sp. MC2013]
MLEVGHITRSYGRKAVLRGVSFNARPGEMVAIIGRNGCGKSTLLRILAGVDPMQKGRVTFWGREASSDRRLFSKYTGFLPQDDPLLDELTVKDNLSLWMKDKGEDYREIIREFDLEPILGQKVSTLSGGMKRRTAIACACAGRPPVLIMDEPTSSLDIYYKKEIRDWMQSFIRGNGIIIASTHDEAEIAESSRVYLMEDGILRPVR